MFSYKVQVSLFSTQTGGVLLISQSSISVTHIITALDDWAIAYRTCGQPVICEHSLKINVTRQLRDNVD